MTIYTDQKLEKNPLMVVSEQSERAEIFALCVRNIYVFLYPTRKTRNLRNSYTWLRASHFCVCVSETCDSSQYFVGESHSLSVQCVLLFVTLVISGADLAFFQGGVWPIVHEPRSGEPIFFFCYFTSREAASRFFLLLFYEREAASRFFLAILRAAKRRAIFFLLFYEPRSGEPIFFCYFTSREARADFIWLFYEPRSGEPIFFDYFEPP